MSDVTKKDEIQEEQSSTEDDKTLVERMENKDGVKRKEEKQVRIDTSNILILAKSDNSKN